MTLNLDNRSKFGDNFKGFGKIQGNYRLLHERSVGSKGLRHAMIVNNT